MKNVIHYHTIIEAETSINLAKIYTSRASKRGVLKRPFGELYVLHF